MVRSSAEGKTGFAIALIVSLAIGAIAAATIPVPEARANAGICLPSPIMWQLPPLVSAIAGMALPVLISLAMILFNKRFNFIPSPGNLYAGAFLLMCFATPLCTRSLSSGSLMAAGTLWGLWMLFAPGVNSPRQESAASMFIIGTIIALGSMVQYAFLMLIPVFAIGAIALKKFGLRELCAMGIGMIAPYWIGLGFGLISLEDFHLPQLSPIVYIDPGDKIVTFVMLGFTAFIGVLTMVVNIMRIYRANSRIRATNTCVNIVGLMAILCICIDYTNAGAYAELLYLFTAFQIGNVLAYNPTSKGGIVLAVIAAVYVGFFIALYYV